MANAQLVTGPVDVDQLGFVLMHEHILTDFIGADRVGTTGIGHDNETPHPSPL